MKKKAVNRIIINIGILALTASLCLPGYPLIADAAVNSGTISTTSDSQSDAAEISTGLISYGALQPASEPTPTAVPIPSAAPLPTPEPAQPIKNGLVKEGSYYRFYKKGTLIKSTWKTIDGRRYYFKSNGNAATAANKIDGKYYVFSLKGQLLAPSKNRIVTVGGQKYYVTTKGTPIPGWHTIGGKLYYVYKNGKCATSVTKDGITFTKNGYAKNDVESKLKIKLMSVISQVTTSKMSKKQKLISCWYWSNDFRFNVWKFPDFTKKDWTRRAALDMINTRTGNCYCQASTFAALAKELGYKPYLVDTGTHCWVEIDGIYYDGMCPNRMQSSGTHPRRSIVKKKFAY
ncbi:MAG: hypothetical protein Q4C91_20410 [Eubacteriales bacterium]|nr:hypothetical protein [Eubacteriales bacterium]